MNHPTRNDHKGLPMFDHPHSRRSAAPVRFVFLGAFGLLTAIILTACGSSSPGNTSAPQPAGTPSSNSDASRPSGGQNAPAASGTVAAVAGTTMQVQSQQNGQVAVSWSGSTKFSHTVTTGISAVKAGQCVTAVAASGTSSSAPAFTATTMVVSSPVNGQCTGGFGGARGQRPPGTPSGGRPPSGFPSGRPSGAAGRSGIGTIASGKVISVSGSTLVIAAQNFGSSNSTPTSKTVTANTSTKITTDAATTSTSVTVGTCVTAQGTANSAGTVAATSVRISDPTNGQCTNGFGGGPNGN
jgi:hypothetical protein